MPWKAENKKKVKARSSIICISKLRWNKNKKLLLQYVTTMRLYSNVTCKRQVYYNYIKLYII